MGAWPTPAGAAVSAAVAGAFVVVGITAVNAAITRSAAGPVRRTLFSGQAVVVSASSSAGLLVGGSVIGLLGVRPTLVGSGLLVAAVSVVVPLVAVRSRVGSAVSGVGSGAQGADPGVEVAPVVAAYDGLDDLEAAVGAGEGVLELRE
jgi:hypothetical protein